MARDFSLPNKTWWTKARTESMNQKEDEAMEKRGQQTVALTNTANKLKGSTNKDDYILKEDGNGLMVNKNRTIAVRDSFVAKQFNKALGVEPNYPAQASPKQFGELAERLEKDRQMRGVPTNTQRFQKNFNNTDSQKPFVKKQPIKSTYTMPKVELAPPIHYEPYLKQRDPEFERQQKRFKELQRQSELDKQPKGIAYLLGEKVPERREKVKIKTTEDYDL